MKKILVLSLLVAGCVPPATNTTKSLEKKPPEQIQNQPGEQPKPPEQPKTKPLETVKISKENIWTFYWQNEINADKKFTGKQIWANMEVDSLGKEPGGYWVRFVAYDASTPRGAVLVHFLPTEADVLSRLSKGQHLEFKAVCKGKNTNFQFYDSCEVIMNQGKAISVMSSRDRKNWN